MAAAPQASAAFSFPPACCQQEPVCEQWDETAAVAGSCRSLGGRRAKGNDLFTFSRTSPSGLTEQPAQSRGRNYRSLGSQGTQGAPPNLDQPVKESDCRRPFQRCAEVVQFSFIYISPLIKYVKQPVVASPRQEARAEGPRKNSL